MQTIKLRTFCNLPGVNKSFIRTIAVNSAAVKVSEDSAQQLKSWKEIPGPSSLPIIGQLLHFLPGGSLHNQGGFQLWERLYKTYGPIVKLDSLLGKPPIIVLYDAANIAQILRGENWMPKRPGFQSLEYYRKEYNKSEPTTRPTGLITDSGDNWKQFRSIVNPVLMQPKTIKLYSTVLDEVAQDMIARIKSLRSENNVIQGKFDLEMNLWALESIGVVALGRRLNCFDENLPKDSPVRQLIQSVHDFFTIAEKIDFKPSIWKYYPTRTFKKAMKIYEQQEKLTKYFVEKALEELQTKSKNLDNEKGVLEKLLEIDEEVAYIMASDMLFAGVDTASNTMMATLYLLATNQKKQNKLREEITSQEERRPYLKACIKESMRMLPVVVGNLRETTKEYNVLGYRIPKNMLVSFSHSYLSMMDSHYPQPNEYIPERWLVGKEDPLYYGTAHPFAFSPFGFGVRSCIGRRIAEMEIEIFLARVIQNFQVEWSGPPPKITTTALNYVTGPFNFIFKDV